jgi:hypothetical protein
MGGFPEEVKHSRQKLRRWRAWGYPLGGHMRLSIVVCPSRKDGVFMIHLTPPRFWLSACAARAPNQIAKKYRRHLKAFTNWTLAGLKCATARKITQDLILPICPSSAVRGNSNADTLTSQIWPGLGRRDLPLRSVVQGLLKLPVFFGTHGFPDFRGQFLQFAQVARGFDRQIETEAAQAQTRRQPGGNGVGL